MSDEKCGKDIIDTSVALWPKDNICAVCFLVCMSEQNIFEEDTRIPPVLFTAHKDMSATELEKEQTTISLSIILLESPYRVCNFKNL